MTTISRFLLVGSALVLATALGRCDSNSSNNNSDGGSGGDMAVSNNPDLFMPALTVTAVSPISASNTGGATLTITGTNFKTGATVTIGGVAATNVIVTSSTQLTCTVPAKAATCGAAAIVVTNPDSTMATANNLFKYRPNTMAFDAAVPYAMGTTTRYVIVADLDNKNGPDLITANSGAAASNLAIRLNTGTGTFGTGVATTYNLGGNSPYAIAAAYLNSDQNLDVIAVRNGSSDVIVRLGDGNGGFTTPTNDITAVGAGPVDIAVGDIDGDGKTDAAVVNNGSQSVSILLSNGDGTFKKPTPATVSTGGTSSPQAVILGSLDSKKDQLIDFAVADLAGDAAFIKFSTGNGTFGTSGTAAETAAADLAAGDFNNDKVLDLAIVSNTVKTVRVAPGDGNGNFGAGVTPTVGATAVQKRSVAVGDFNLDGNLDIAVTTNTEQTIFILLGQGDGTFATPVSVTLGNTADANQMSVADLNGDGLPDIVTNNQSQNGVLVVLNKCS